LRFLSAGAVERVDDEWLSDHDEAITTAGTRQNELTQKRLRIRGVF
jgi:hypothetical protein